MAAGEVDAGAVTTEARPPRALVHIHALVAGRGEGEPIAADAPEAAGHVGAGAVAADARPAPALVQVPALPAGGPKGVALGAGAVEAAGGVLALCVALAPPGPALRALVPGGGGGGGDWRLPVYALVGPFVVPEPRVTLTPEAAHQVDAAAVLADVGHNLALVDLLQVASQWVDNLTRPSASTECSVFRTSLKR